MGKFVDLPEPEMRAVREPVRHDSAIEHVAGSARYVDDMPEPQGVLHLGVHGADIASGRIKKMELDAVRTAPGVVAVLTAEDIPGKNDLAPVTEGDPVFSDGDIKFLGQVVFAVVAETRMQARKAAKLAKITYDENQPVLTIDDAIAAQSRVAPDYAMKRGDAEDALEKGTNRLSGKIDMGGQEQFYLEGQVSLAIPGEGGEVMIYCSTQHPAEVQNGIAEVLDCDNNLVTVECRRMGGGFGGKESQAAPWAAMAALAALKTGKACKIRLDRDDDMVMTGKRHPMRCSYDVAFDDGGVIQAIVMEFDANCGCSADLSGGICDRALFHADNTYYFENATINSRRLMTNTVSNTAFRGFGGPQGMVGIETVIDAIARHLGRDPLDIRVANLYGDKGRDVTPYHMTVEDNIAPEIIAGLEKSSDYRARREQITAFNADNPFLKKGLALTPIKFGISFTVMHLNQAGALVNVYRDGSITVNHGGTEMGQGLYIKVAQVVADEFGVDIGRVRVTATTTGKVPNTSPTAASSGTDLNGMAAKAAARKIRKRLAEFAAERFQSSPDDIAFSNNQVSDGKQTLDFDDLVDKAYFDRIGLSDSGFYKTPKIHYDQEAARGRPFYYFSYGAACSEMTIDTLTGEMRVDQVDILHDVGHSLNPAMDIGQIEGGFVQGMGWVTTEELWWDGKGSLRTHAPSTYKIPTAFDVPEKFNVTLYDGKGNVEETIYRSKAVGEPPLMLAISVFAAISDAIASIGDYKSLPALELPATPEHILAAVEQMQGASA
jgi:xanthine dehydrogenase large subunit